MAQAHPRITNTRPRGADKRAYPRIPLRLAAHCVSGAGGAQRACEIRNFCAGGLLLHYAAHDRGDYLPVVGDVVEVRARGPEGADGHDLTFRARIMRAAPDSAGVALIDPDPAMLRALVRCAEEQRAVRRSGLEKAPAKLDPAAMAALMKTCRERVLGASARFIEDVLNHLIAELTVHEPQIGSIGEQQLRLDFLAVLRSERAGLSARFLSAVTDRIDDGVNGTARPQGATPEPLSLLGNEELEVWLSVSETVNHVESRLGGPLADLELRLAQLGAAVAEPRENPFGPQTFAEAFQEMIEQLQPAPGVRQTCFQVFKLLLTGWMETLCRDLNGLLSGHGVLPEIRQTIVRNEHRDRPRAESGTDMDRDLYAIVRDIRHLQRQYGHHHPPLATHTGAGTGAGVPAMPALSTGEIIAALSHLRTAAPVHHGGERPGLRERVLDALPGGALGARENGIIDVADTLFTSMLSDGLVGSNVHSWLEQLELPLLRLALRDDSIFTDRRHIAREVVNRIARLELQNTGDDGAGGSALRREVDGLVDAISTEERPDPGIFTRALKKLDLLIGIQNQAYADNLREVIVSCEAEPERAPAAGEIDDEQRLWLKRVGRMKVGDWVLFATDPAKPRRLRLAWISKDRDRFVFVNTIGLKEATWEAPALTRCLAGGEAVVMDSVDEPALDRAQYAMLQNLHRQLLHETTHDQLTGLINRQEFERRLQAVLEQSSATGVPHSLFHLDLAQFSVINNTCGHDVGDRVLQEIAALLHGTTGENTLIARIGSDEFGILLADRPPEHVPPIAQRVLDAIRDYRYIWCDEARTVAAGLGIVHIAGFDGISDLLQAAESSCCAARETGINQYHVYNPDSAAQASRNEILKWLNRIDKALADGTLELRCQRIMTADAENMQGVPHHSEILLGVTDDRGMLVSPQQFIITAEHYQRMPSIDRWVVSTMLRFIVDNRARLDHLGGFAINLSGSSISDESFKDFIRAEIAKTGAPMEYVCFEITETAGITSLSDVADFITEMHATGCRFSLDDFGSGLSSYVYLKNLPVDYLKIDGSFVRDMDTNPADYAVVRSITEIGHFMGKKIIAESVESEAVLEQLRAIGVDYVQGYAIGRPISLRELD